MDYPTREPGFSHRSRGEGTDAIVYFFAVARLEDHRRVGITTKIVGAFHWGVIGSHWCDTRRASAGAFMSGLAARAFSRSCLA